MKKSIELFSEGNAVVFTVFVLLSFMVHSILVKRIEIVPIYKSKCNYLFDEDYSCQTNKLTGVIL